MKTYLSKCSSSLRLAGMVFLCLITGSLVALGGQPRSPFGIETHLKKDAKTPTVEVGFTIPENCVLYFDRLHFMTEAGDEITPSTLPQPVLEIDKATQKEKKVYEHNFKAEVSQASLLSGGLIVKFQGCTNAECYFPEKRIFKIGASGDYSEVIDQDEEATAASPLDPASDWAKEMHDYRVSASQSGFMAQKGFLAFLDRAATGHDDADNPMGKLGSSSLIFKLAIILLGGFLLNLTPCVLPMIPINLAIIGAGTSANSKFSGFRNGSIYGLGMALAYGVLGLGVVLTGAKFGTINSTIWFNLVIAAVFIVLGLGMFGVINIDVSRFGGNIGPRGGASSKGGILQMLLIFVMGTFAALMAGACVAPVVIAVMIYSTSAYGKGDYAALLLPFLLGTGMALPWPFAGAGIGFLPKPGVWMNRVKHVFGLLIILFALYYCHLAYESYQARQDSTALANAPAGSEASKKNNANLELAQALRQGREQGKPVVIDFHASWCKNCVAMDETVFNRAEVKKRLQDFILVRYDAESPNKNPAKEVLDHFNVLGLPSFVVLTTAK